MNGNFQKIARAGRGCKQHRQREQTRDLLDRAERILDLAVRLALMVNNHTDHVVVLSKSLADLIQVHRKILSGQCILLDKKVMLNALEAHEAKKKPLDHRRVPKRTFQASPK